MISRVYVYTLTCDGCGLKAELRTSGTLPKKDIRQRVRDTFGWQYKRRVNGRLHDVDLCDACKQSWLPEPEGDAL